MYHHVHICILWYLYSTENSCEFLNTFCNNTLMSDFRSSITFHLLYIPVHTSVMLKPLPGERAEVLINILLILSMNIQFRNKKLLLLGMTIISSFQNAWQIISMDDIRRGHVLDMDTADDLDSHDE